MVGFTGGTFIKASEGSRDSMLRELPAVGLDYAKCIDNVDPRLACDLLAAAGFPTAIVHMLRHTWQQKRF